MIVSSHREIISNKRWGWFEVLATKPAITDQDYHMFCIGPRKASLSTFLYKPKFIWNKTQLVKEKNPRFHDEILI